MAVQLQAVVEREPDYLVLMPSVDSVWPHLEEVSGAMRAAAQPNPGNPSKVNLPAVEYGGAETIVYERLGVVAMDLDGEAREEMESRGALVIENKVWRLPPVMESENGTLDVEALTWGLQAIRLDPGSPYNGDGIRVAILDTGIDLNHAAFAGRCAANFCRSFVPGALTVQDGHGHGSHCAGTIGGSVLQGPRYSIAPRCTLIVGKVLSDAGSGYTRWIVEGMNWAAYDADAHIINMSLGGSRGRDAAFDAFYESTAGRILQQGSLIIAAAGNDSVRPGPVAPIGNPAACPSIDAVAAIDSSRTVAYFSCAGDAVKSPNYSAPGVDIYSAWTGGGHKTISGTSMAAPHVSGTAALHAQATGFRGAALRNVLINKASQDPLGAPADYGLGLIHAP